MDITDNYTETDIRERRQTSSLYSHGVKTIVQYFLIIIETWIQYWSQYLRKYPDNLWYRF